MKPKKVRLVMLNDFPSFWKAGDKRRVKECFVPALLMWGWAKLADEEKKPEEKKP